MDYKKLGENVRKYRLQSGLKQEELSVKVGCTASHIGKIENARTKPSLELVVDIATVLGVTPDSLLTDAVDAPELIYLKELERRIKKLPTPSKIMACDAMADLLGIIEQLYK